MDKPTLDAAALSFLLRSDGTTWRGEQKALREKVATLEAELAAANELADGYRLAVDDSDHRGMGWMAHANALRDALEKANAAFNAWGRDEDGIHPEAWPAVEHLREVLKMTPAASLAAHDAAKRVVECALAWDAATHDYASGPPDQPYCSPQCPKHLAESALEDAVEASRALAAQAATHSVPDGTSEVTP